MTMQMIDGNEAAARIAHKCNEVIAIYPITPASSMGELADIWSADGEQNIYGSVPEVIEMQSEAGAAGAIHGALQSGSMSTTFTASQGLLLMIPNMYKIAGELTPTVFHVAARTVATHALSIFGDHSDVMAVRGTGFAMLAASSVQEAHDFALISQAASLASRIPFVHFFDGFRTSHEINEVEIIDDNIIRQMISKAEVSAHKKRALNPEHPVLRGSSQNPDTFFQQREASNIYYDQVANKVAAAMERFGVLTGRHYKPFEYIGHPQAEEVVILMGSGIGPVKETINELNQQGRKVGAIKVRLFRPFATEYLLKALPLSLQRIAVLDRTKEPGADGEPLFKDIITALASHANSELWPASMPQVCGGRYGISSKEFTPAMVAGIFDMLASKQLKHGFTVGIKDDVTHTSLDWDENFVPASVAQQFKAVFYGLGSDGTVSANRNSIKIIGEQTDNHAQGYFVYDSKKTGAVTVSHLRFGKQPIESTYLISKHQADFVACHQEIFLQRYAMLDMAKPGAIFLLNSSLPTERVWNSLPEASQQIMLDKGIQLWHINADAVAAETGMGKRINTIMQSAFFAISNVLPKDQAIAYMKQAAEQTYSKKGEEVVAKNHHAIDMAVENVQQICYPKKITSERQMRPAVAAQAPAFVQQVTGPIIAGHGDELPVSAFPIDGTWPTGTAAWEKRNLAKEIPVWEADMCIDCGKCPFICPHAAIRSKAFTPDDNSEHPLTFKASPIKGKEFEAGTLISYQVAPEDCTGCGLCVEICPAKDKHNPDFKALNMAPLTAPLLDDEKVNWQHFLSLPEYDRTDIRTNTIKGSMLMQPLFEFSGACTGCGETPYVRLASQLFGERMVVANATGCSSIYGGNLPTTPWTITNEGRGPAWSNSLFEDNAEFGMGMRVAIDQQLQEVNQQLNNLRSELGDELVDALLNGEQETELGIHQQRQHLAQLIDKLEAMGNHQGADLLDKVDVLIRRSVWIIGGDGWAYDIGFGGVDHTLASGRDINILVLDTEVYSNTGGQTSKATPVGAGAKFSAAGKRSSKKNLADVAISYGNVFVAQVAYGAKDLHTLKMFLAAEAYPGTSLIIAYAPCISHGVDLHHNHERQRLAVETGHWPLFHYDPRLKDDGNNPMVLDSKAPSRPYIEFMQGEGRFNHLHLNAPEIAEQLQQQAQREADERWQHYQRLAQD